MYISTQEFGLQNYRLRTRKLVDPFVIDKVGTAYKVTKDNFPILDGVTCYALEIWEECMRLPHWHPNAFELGYVVSGTIEVMIWRSPGETAMFTLTSGMCWFIPQGALHSLNNIGKEHAVLLVGFSSEYPQDIDLPVAYNGIPISIREAYTSPHSELRTWSGLVSNRLVGKFQNYDAVSKVVTGSPYAFDLAKVTPLYQHDDLGSIIWGVKSNWSILQNISMLRANLKPNVARDAIWYPDAGTLYVVTKGSGQFHVVIAEHELHPLNVELHDYVYIPAGILHTFLNASLEDFEVVAFFTKADPQPEGSLSVASAFFPNSIRREAMTEYGREHKSGDPLKDLKFTTTSPYLLKI